MPYVHLQRRIVKINRLPNPTPAHPTRAGWACFTICGQTFTLNELLGLGIFCVACPYKRYMHIIFQYSELSSPSTE